MTTISSALLCTLEETSAHKGRCPDNWGGFCQGLNPGKKAQVKTISADDNKATAWRKQADSKWNKNKTGSGDERYWQNPDFEIFFTHTLFTLNLCDAMCVPTWELWEMGWQRPCPQVWVLQLGASWPAGLQHIWRQQSGLGLLKGRPLWLGWWGEASVEEGVIVWAAAQTQKKRNIHFWNLAKHSDATRLSDSKNMLSI